MVLDNFEHLLEQVGLVNEILQAAPKLKVLTTSRERLQLSGETILLAAAWIDLPSPQETAEEIGQSLDFLESGLRDVPDCQRSIRAVFEHSWGRLGEAECYIFMKLSVQSMCVVSPHHLPRPKSKRSFRIKTKSFDYGGPRNIPD